MNPLQRLAAITLVGLSAAFGTARADNTVRLLVGFPPGGGTDAIARVLADKLRGPLNANVIVDNRPGAGGQLAARALKSAPADGSVLMLSHDHTISILPLVTKNAGFHPPTDFVPVVGIATFVNGLALSPGTPARTYSEFIHWVQGNGGRSTIGVPAPGSIPEFLVKTIAQKHKLDIQAVPYRGGAPMMTDMLGNQVPAGLAGQHDFQEYLHAGKFRMVAVIGGKREPTLPDVPTFAELGMPGFEDLAYYGFFAPAGTPQAVLDRYSAAIGKIIAEPAVRERLNSMGVTVVHMPPAQFARHVNTYTQNWERIIRTNGYTAP